MPQIRQRFIRGAVLVGGILVTQFILFGPSLLGRKILLPLDNLALTNCYLSPADSKAWGDPWDPILTDPIFEVELDRRFAVSEVRAGRLPLWNPHRYCGEPFLAVNSTSIFSPYRLLDYLWPDPKVIAWDQVLKALVAGIGAYLFFRVAMETAYFPALIGGWVWPICGYFIQWTGHPLSTVATWLPLIFLCTDQALRQSSAFWGAGLALTTLAALVSGHADIAVQILFFDGIFFIWRFFHIYGWKGARSRRAITGVLTVLTGWGLGAMLSAPQSLPTQAYLRTSHRIMDRLANGSTTPTVGAIAIPQLVLPDFNGATRGGAAYIGRSGNVPESASSGYVGLITALILAPLAACNRKRRSWFIFSIALMILGMGQILGLPILKEIYDSYPFSALRENRLVLGTAWGILIAGVIGLEALDDRQIETRGWFWFAAAAPAALGAWSLYRAFYFPDGLQKILASVTPDMQQSITQAFGYFSLRGFGLCVVAMVIWFCLARGLARYRWFVWGIAMLTVCEMIFADYNIYPQCDPAMYYPNQPILSKLAQAPPGRVCAVRCLPACLTETTGLYDVRGYDGVDPGRLVDLAHLTQPGLFRYRIAEAGFLQNYFPEKFPSPITRIMNLRYLIWTPSSGTQSTSETPGYGVFEDGQCLPRTFVPHKIVVVDDQARRLQLISKPDFNPAEISYVESPGKELDQPAQGDAKIISELPSHLTIEFNMQTPGVIVLSDLWDEGWQARVNGTEVPVLRVNHAFRGVLTPAGKGVVQYDYEPPSFIRGIKLAATAGAILLIWSVASLWNSLGKTRNPKFE